MDMWLILEFIELLSAIFYLLITRGRYESRLTRKIFGGIIACLAIDIFIFHRHRPDAVKWFLNTPTFLYCYEKIYRKYARQAGKKVATILLLLFG